MRKVVVICMVAMLILGISVSNVSAEKDPAAAGLLSAVMRGTGEWYNSGFSGAFPWAECCVGAI